MKHAITIDVEDYHNVISRDWFGRDMAPTDAVVGNTRRMLGLLQERGVRGTCFVLGEVVDAFPELIREIAAAGHELGVHGYYHRQVFKLTREAFFREVADAKKRIEDVAGVAVWGHRAPAFSITPETDWALEVLIEARFRYDSSIYPIKGRRYGWPGFPLDIHEMPVNGASIVEAPMTTVAFAGKRLPACGGGYLRHLPMAYTRWAFRQVSAHRPVIVYLHPYEVEVPCATPDLSALEATEARKCRLRHRMQQHNRSTVAGKIGRLLDRYEFAPLIEVIESTLGRTLRT